MSILEYKKKMSKGQTLLDGFMRTTHAFHLGSYRSAAGAWTLGILQGGEGTNVCGRKQSTSRPSLTFLPGLQFNCEPNRSPDGEDKRHLSAWSMSILFASACESFSWEKCRQRNGRQRKQPNPLAYGGPFSLFLAWGGGGRPLEVGKLGR